MDTYGNGTRRVVITGLGAVTPLGLDMATTWQRLLAGENSAGRLSRFDTSDYLVQIGCEVKDFDPSRVSHLLPLKEARRLDLGILYAVAAADEALRDANFKVESNEQGDSVGTLIGTGMGGLNTLYDGHETLFQKGPKRVSPFVSTYMLPNMPAGQVAILYNLRGPSYCLVSACATGTHAIGEAAELIRRGDADVMVAGGTEAGITPFGVAAFHRTGALSSRNDEPERASRPFDRERDGFVMGEGAAVLVLESLEHAQARGATILAEVTGYAMTTDAYHISAPPEGGEGAVRSMRMALRKAGMQPRDIDYINAHGTSTPLNDKSETAAIKQVFGEAAYDIPISSTKSMMGHLLGAAGAIEAAVSVKTIQDGMIHPTINLEHPDPECDLDYVPGAARQAQVRSVMSSSFGFGGHNATIILRAFENGNTSHA